MQGSANEQLKSDRLVFYKSDIQRLETELDELLELTRARCAVLIDKEGHLVTRRGESVVGSIESFSALVAGCFAATHEMARLLGEEQFATLFHQGERTSIQVSLVGARSLLGIVWDERTNLGLVRFYSQETTGRLAEIFQAMHTREHAPEGEEDLSGDYSKEATAALDDLF
jgi:predicted regulator of Ras-like GTPase activity (Roadblock/LC7/MglB family)